MRVILGLVLWSVAEISAFVLVGGWIGLAGVLALVLGSGVAGVMLLRGQGMRLAAALQGRGVMQGRGALLAAGQAGLLALAAVLLIMPGLLTDLAGLVLLVPQVRRWIAGRTGVRVAGSADVVEATAVEVGAVEVEVGKLPSVWTKP